jgi:6,7-dimethyl-8-ribityllumazine synthase
MPNNHEGNDDAGGLRFAVVVSRYNDFITKPLLDGCVATLTAKGAADSEIDVYWVPGAFEIPLVTQRAAQSGDYDAVICLGAVILGETDHYRLVAEAAANGIARVGLDTGVPCIFEVLATPTTKLAVARAGGDAGNKGEEAALAAIETVRVLKSVREA